MYADELLPGGYIFFSWRFGKKRFAGEPTSSIMRAVLPVLRVFILLWCFTFGSSIVEVSSEASAKRRFPREEDAANVGGIFTGSRSGRDKAHNADARRR